MTSNVYYFLCSILFIRFVHGKVDAPVTEENCEGIVLIYLEVFYQLMYYYFSFIRCFFKVIISFDMQTLVICA